MSDKPEESMPRGKVPVVPVDAIDREVVLAWLAYACLVASVIFQLTVLPETLAIRPVSRLMNAGLLVTFVGLFVITAPTLRVSVGVMYFYIMPILLILLGYGINMMRSISLESLGYASIFISFTAAVSIPFLKRFEIKRAWEIYYWVVLILCLISLIEYALVFSNLLPVTVHPNDRNYFLRGVLTIFFHLGNMEPHYRLYGVFFEPGTAAMLMLPALAFSLVCRRLIGMFVFLMVFMLTDSLGGYVALALTLAVAAYVWLHRMLGAGLWRVFVVFLVVPAVLLVAVTLIMPAYIHKGASAAVREQNIVGFFSGFFGLISSEPFGLRLSGTSLTQLGDNAGYLGSNFMLYVAYVQGGVLSAFGYFVLFCTAMLAMGRVILSPAGWSPTTLCAAISMPGMLMFAFQRGSIFETVLLGFLYAVPMMDVLSGSMDGGIERNRPDGSEEARA